MAIGDDNIILNPEFDDGLDNWAGNGCKIELHDALDDGKVLPANGKYFVVNHSFILAFALGTSCYATGVVQYSICGAAKSLAYITSTFLHKLEYGANIIQNSNLDDGINGWFPLGPCTLSVHDGAPRVLPPMAQESLALDDEPLNGKHIHVTNRMQTWMGPAQIVTDKLTLYATYQVSAWVRVGAQAGGAPQNINIAVAADSQWLNGGQVLARDERWYEGPDAGVDLMVAGLQVFPVDRKARVKHLKRLTDKVRKRDVVVKVTGADGGAVKQDAGGVEVRVRQVSNSFPLGSCIMRTNMDNEDFVDFCSGASSSVDNAVQQWVKTLSADDLSAAVKIRLTGLLTRYKGKFRHYDVNNEMLHGSFYQDKLGKDIRATMFKTAAELDPDALLFVNDYNVESMCDIRATPETYIQQIIGLQEQGAPVGGVGLQGHVSNPVGPVIRSVLDRLAVLGLPIWFTEVDVSSANEHVRADDLEVMLREAYAHPAVEGVMLWGFWELFMSRDDAHLVDAEGQVNEAGRRLLQLKREWLTHAHGHADDNGEFKFRGHHGEYHVDVTTPTGKISQTFTVDKDDAPLVLNIKV
ncbi:Endo-1,4-beta-xylanase C [Panicum miliaceum]|uniref:Endo-1,4-beta-xylanase C n=1 Tax=Panicum miliaceum TaxID=4540 RepID=A0A3L6TPH8_PANMI|nr:Endo-1,4-beta-xylanase C [Panicum miliaceum]